MQEGKNLDSTFITHKVILHILLTARNADAAHKAGRRRTAAELYQQTQQTVQRVMQMRWLTAHALRHKDGGAAVARFRKLWEAPGLAVFREDITLPTLVLFMSPNTRARWRTHTTSARDFRRQQFAPPAEPPSDTLEVFIAGAADPRAKNTPPPPAGYGAVAVAINKRQLLRLGGPIVARRTPNVLTTTSNLAELVAFTRALQWAARHPLATGRPICIRYNSEYAARIATGAWKAKKHKAMAAEARQSWAKLHTIPRGYRHTYMGGWR